MERRQIHTKLSHFMLLRNILFVIVGSREEPPQESGLVWEIFHPLKDILLGVPFLKVGGSVFICELSVYCLQNASASLNLILF